MGAEQEEKDSTAGSRKEEAKPVDHVYTPSACAIHEYLVHFSHTARKIFCFLVSVLEKDAELF